jgi:hypothetical protein
MREKGAELLGPRESGVIVCFNSDLPTTGPGKPLLHAPNYCMVCWKST